MSDLAVTLGGVVAAIIGLLALFRVGKRAGKMEAENDDLQEDVETARRINRVRGLAADGARERLRDRKPSGDL